MGKVRAATQRQMHTIHVHTHPQLDIPPSPCPPSPLPCASLPAPIDRYPCSGSRPCRLWGKGTPLLVTDLLLDAEAHTPSPGPPPSGFALLLLLAFALSQNLCSGSTGSTPDPSITGLARLDMDAHAPLLSGTICDQGITT
ncbi:hypothetical protein CABS01_14116 [Colletotrichum abscissum]|uniref:Uncharacterized protein n=1 Tax=Colletotrichum abscissum TaxID=1671311 RepID=A0A9Q0AZP5_9PEZI|nr:uncharacterized protein CABS01_14116 [Colletotrichum abscissum]KAI3537609.1 hypothetical protein CABS02_12086 [Colletotrichum abscissum]KAK1481918.1 hypothetical protein CABS01_14116 [Colletotrichum abscissum]